MEGLWKRPPAHCHWLSPVERAFNMTWSYVRRNKRHNPKNGVSPVHQVHAAMEHYSVGGPGGMKMKNLFNIYRRNHRAYRQRALDAIREGIDFV